MTAFKAGRSALGLSPTRYFSKSARNGVLTVSEANDNVVERPGRYRGRS